MRSRGNIDIGGGGGVCVGVRKLSLWKGIYIGKCYQELVSCAEKMMIKKCAAPTNDA